MAERARLYSIPGGGQDQDSPRPSVTEPRPAVAEPRPAVTEPRRPETGGDEPLWREVLGRRLRVIRQEHEQTLAVTAGRAGISPQYLSEVERGRKEPSSEMIAALAGALGTTLIDLTEQVAGDLRRLQTVTAAPRAPLAPRAQVSSLALAA